jgi:hypothetical protein
VQLDFGPFLSERAWGTVREDTSRDGGAWESFPHDDARRRAYRWSEDGLAGICDRGQRVCFALAFWNGRDPILKERIFGLTNREGNHGEDAKELWWYVDSTPSHSFMRWRYLYPQQAFPYDQLVAENARRTRADPELELVDTGVLAGGYFDVTVDYAKAAPDDVCIRVRVRNAGPPAELDVLPTLWFRNVWQWGEPRPELRTEAGAIVGDGIALTGGGEPLFCENETGAKEGIGLTVLHGAPTAERGTKAALRHHLSLAAGETAELRLRLAPEPRAYDEQVREAREREADAFYEQLAPGLDPERALVLRRALAGMLWSKQFFHYDVEKWLDEAPRTSGRNRSWRHLNNSDVISMPDKWEYPWYAAWDLAFHTVALAHVDPELAKSQLVLLCREWFMHPNGQLPAYEWEFSDVNPPVHAWAALRVFELDGSRDHDFLERIFHKLLLNFTWWVNRKDSQGNNLFEGGFLGLDNIGPFDRSQGIPGGGVLEQSDGTGWMAMYCLNLWEIALELCRHDDSYEDVATKFFEHFTLVARAMLDQGLWNDEDGFFYDVLNLPDGERVPVRLRSIVGLIPLCATTTLSPETLERLPDFARRFDWYCTYKPHHASVVIREDEYMLLSIVDAEQLRRVLGRMLDESEFLSPHGLRALSRSHLEEPFELRVGDASWRVGYEPGESAEPLFGGNSNWRGPIWFPVNFLLIEALRRFHRFLGEGFTVEHPTGSGRLLTLDQVADELSERLISLFLRGANGRRPAFDDVDPSFGDVLLFHEYFHGDTGKGLGASHQTGWTGLVANLILRR